MKGRTRICGVCSSAKTVSGSPVSAHSPPSFSVREAPPTPRLNAAGSTFALKSSFLSSCLRSSSCCRMWLTMRSTAIWLFIPGTITSA